MNPYNMLPTVHASSSDLNVASAVLKPFYPTSRKITFEGHIGYHATRLAAYRWTGTCIICGWHAIWIFNCRNQGKGQSHRQALTAKSSSDISKQHTQLLQKYRWRYIADMFLMTLSNTQGHFRHCKTGLKTVSSRTFSNNVMQKMTRKDVQSISDLVTCTLTCFYRATFAAFDAPCVGHQDDQSQAVLGGRQ